MLSELFHYFRKHGQEIARRCNCEYVTLEFLGDLSGSLLGWGATTSRYNEITVFSFIDIKDAIKKFRKEIDSWQD